MYQLTLNINRSAKHEEVQRSTFLNNHFYSNGGATQMAFVSQKILIINQFKRVASIKRSHPSHLSLSLSVYLSIYVCLFLYVSLTYTITQILLANLNPPLGIRFCSTSGFKKGNRSDV